MPINENQIEEADAAIEQAVTTFVSEFESMWGRWEDVAPAYIVESTLLDLSENLCELSDEMKSVVKEDRRRRSRSMRWPPTGT